MRCVAGTLATLISVVAVSAGGGVGPAAAVGPPPIDAHALVRYAPVGPPEATEQRTLCANTSATGSTVGSNPSAAQSMLNLPEAWRFSRGGGQTVAVIDTGVTPHPRLPRLRGGGDYVSSGDGLVDCDAHGTLVAGIIAAAPSPDDAFAGVAPDAALISIRQSSAAYGPAASPITSDATSVGRGYGSVRTLAHAIVRAVDLGATVINISEAACAPITSPIDDGTLGAAIKFAYDRDVVVVVAAGNLSADTACRQQNPDPGPADPDGWTSVTTVASPARFAPYVLTVGAVDADTATPSGFSLHGPWVGVAAPGTGIVGLDARDGSARPVDALEGADGPVPIAGTSFATPYVAGTVALVRARFPHLHAQEVIRRIIRTAHAPAAGHDTRIGHGVIDPVAALTDQITDAGADLTAARPISAPATPPAEDRTARDVGLAGAGLSVALVVAVLAIAMPHRRIRRLDPDDY
ncbi:type VII secretion-associated serine protease mycosin [Gordonia sp. CPCC 206044]|uniref:type VII secretion-associated serine protease mycosin n=1 Tax=Gordonia sp. CPCC 206044 TaxID=3140793 RepID=UPI003AF3A17E